MVYLLQDGLMWLQPRPLPLLLLLLLLLLAAPCSRCALQRKYIAQQLAAQLLSAAAACVEAFTPGTPVTHILRLLLLLLLLPHHLPARTSRAHPAHLCCQCACLGSPAHSHQCSTRISDCGMCCHIACSQHDDETQLFAAPTIKAFLCILASTSLQATRLIQLPQSRGDIASCYFHGASPRDVAKPELLC
jgi:hypothetical protein